MKAKVRKTGKTVFVDIAEGIRSMNDKVNVVYVDGNGVLYDDIELDFNDVYLVDYEKVRIDASVRFMQEIISRPEYNPLNHVCCGCSDDVNPYMFIAQRSVMAADALIEELKKNKDEQRDSIA